MYGSFFKHIDTQEKAYILGLLFADGCLKSGGDIALEEGSIELLRTISSILGCNAPVYISPQENRYSKKGQYKLHMGKECANLEKIIGKEKEFFPVLCSDLMHHFIRGVFDGDGCVSIDNRYLNLYPDSAIPGEFYMLFNYLAHAEYTRSVICDATDNSFREIDIKTGNGTTIIYKIRWSGTKSIVKIRDWLYKDATIFLQKKKEKIFSIRAGNRKEAAKKGGLAYGIIRRKAKKSVE